MGFLPTLSWPWKIFAILHLCTVLTLIYVVVVHQDVVVPQTVRLLNDLYDRLSPADLASERIRLRMHHAVISQDHEYLKGLCVQPLSAEGHEQPPTVSVSGAAQTWTHFDPRTHKVVCDMNTPTKEFTLLMTAYMSKKISSAKLLLEMGADPNALSQDHSLLMLAVDRNETDWVDLLLTHKADPNALHPETSYSPLMLATFSDHRQVAHMLIKAGANLDYQVPKTGISALMLAAANGLDDMAKLLLAAGADSFLEDKIQRTAMEIAKVHGHHNLELLLIAHMSRHMKHDGPSDFNPGFSSPTDGTDVKSSDLIEEKQDAKLSNEL